MGCNLVYDWGGEKAATCIFFYFLIERHYSNPRKRRIMERKKETINLDRK